jgi:hypothetical protein
MKLLEKLNNNIDEFLGKFVLSKNHSFGEVTVTFSPKNFVNSMTCLRDNKFFFI